jgi:hypothetical protein
MLRELVYADNVIRYRCGLPIRVGSNTSIITFYEIDWDRPGWAYIPENNWKIWCDTVNYIKKNHNKVEIMEWLEGEGFKFNYGKLKKFYTIYKPYDACNNKPLDYRQKFYLNLMRRLQSDNSLTGWAKHVSRDITERTLQTL